jgi:hypothetical protein
MPRLHLGLSVGAGGVEAPMNLARRTGHALMASMNHESLRLLIRQKLADGRLPCKCLPRIWGGASHGETCGACDEIIEGREMSIEGIELANGRTDVQLHAQCFYLWNDERP